MALGPNGRVLRRSADGHNPDRLRGLPAIGRNVSGATRHTDPAGVGTTGEFPSVLDPGTYEIEVVLSGDNVKPTRAAGRIHCPSHWSNNETQMIQAAAVTRAR